MAEEKAPLFSASRTKLGRAKQFIIELESAMAAFKASNPVSGRLDGATNQIEFTIQPITDVPGAIVGDTIHNLRAALDLMASELARLNGKSDKNVYFPFSDGPDTFDEAIRKKQFDKTGQDAVDLVKRFAPYRGGNAALRAVHDLDVQDKHTSLILTTSRFQVSFMATYDVNNVDAGVVIPNLEGMHYKFPKDSPAFADELTVERLKNLVELVEGILEAFTHLVEFRAASKP